MQYQGGCQCGAVRFQVEVGLDRPVICNCSRCQKLGAVLVFAPEAAFTLERGAEAQTEYLFNTRKIRHLFCKTCGIQSFSRATGPDGTPMVAVNVNALEGVEPREIAARAHAVDGRAR